MSDSPTPEKVLIGAALDLMTAQNAVLPAWFCDAVAVYRKATEPPKPFEAWVKRYTVNGEFGRIWHPLPIEPRCPGLTEVWRCIITPTERVR